MKPLDGIRVLELGRVLACPFAGMILAELGAEVIKVEHPRGGDETRSYEPFFGSPRNDEARGESSGYFRAYNRSKSSVTVDFRKPEGKAIIRRLAEKCDVLIENFPTGTLSRHGLDWPALRLLNQRLVYVSCTGFGQTGPERERKGYDTVFQAMGGLMSVTGPIEGDPVKPGIPVADLTSGLWIALAVLAALHGRAATGQGSFIDYAMMDGLMALMGLPVARHLALGEVPRPMGTEHPGRVPSASFVTADGGHVHITGADQHWRPLCRALGIEPWGTDPRFSDNSGRVAHRAEVMAGIAGAVARLTRAEVMALLDAENVPNGPIRTIPEMLACPQTAAREMLRAYAHPVDGDCKGIALPLRFSGYDEPGFARPPLLGEHTALVLRGLLGLSDADMASLQAERVTG